MMVQEEKKISIRFEGGGFDISGPPIVVIIAGILLAISIVWVVKDARARNKNPILAVFFIVFGAWPISMFWWLWLRPERDNKEVTTKIIEKEAIP